MKNSEMVNKLLQKIIIYFSFISLLTYNRIKIKMDSFTKNNCNPYAIEKFMESIRNERSLFFIRAEFALHHIFCASESNRNGKSHSMRLGEV